VKNRSCLTFEIAMALVDPAAISHWSALHHHALTEQAPRRVFVLTPLGGPLPSSAQWLDRCAPPGPGHFLFCRGGSGTSVYRAGVHPGTSCRHASPNWQTQHREAEL